MLPRCALVLTLLSSVAGHTLAEESQDAAACLDALDVLEVKYKRIRRRGIDVAVAVRGPIGGVEFQGYAAKPLVLDCSLVYSLAQSGRFFAAHGITKVRYSSAYERRHIRGTKRLSRHSYGLAIDIHTFRGDSIGSATVRDDYEQGLGDSVDCIGRPLTQHGYVLRTLDCQLSRSGLFRVVLTPDYDADHYNHFHVESLPWASRDNQRPDDS